MDSTEPTRRGRPPGAKNRPRPTDSHIKEAVPQRIQRHKPATEQYQGIRNISNLKLDTIAHAILKIHAQRRGIPLAWLIQDVLNEWITASTDYRQAIWQDILPRNARAPKTPERFAGYLDSLGFIAPTNQANIEPAVMPTAQAPTFEGYAQQPPLPVPQRSLTDLTQRYQHPITTGPASYPHPEPTLPAGSAAFNPEEHRRTAAPQGYGSAAQMATNGQTPADPLPPLNEDVERWRDHYRVRPEDIR